MSGRTTTTEDNDVMEHLPFFFLLGPFVLTSVVTCSTSGSSVFSTDMVRISKCLGSHFIVSVPNSVILMRVGGTQ